MSKERIHESVQETWEASPLLKANIYFAILTTRNYIASWIIWM